MEPLINPNNTWTLVEQRMRTEQDPVVRRNLELVAKHMRCEAIPDIEGVLSTLCPKPYYRLHYQGALEREIGGSIERIRQLYEDSIVTNQAYRLEHNLVRVIADAGSVYTEGPYRQAYLGRFLIAMGYPVDDPDAYYMAECYLSMVWPRDPETGLLAGEEMWKDRDMFAGIEGRKISLDQIQPLAA